MPQEQHTWGLLGGGEHGHCLTSLRMTSLLDPEHTACPPEGQTDLAVTSGMGFYLETSIDSFYLNVLHFCFTKVF